ncbi:hypothetical protein IQ07DRAFT_191542 [Pyrenochaeta sp. DS3sAY3a]|nr:hypothetical protein IQ07DRAFT_191542 [Pyrenochaeta sp. DS3sAY3a]
MHWRRLQGAWRRAGTQMVYSRRRFSACIDMSKPRGGGGVRTSGELVPGSPGIWQARRWNGLGRVLLQYKERRGRVRRARVHERVSRSRCILFLPLFDRGTGGRMANGGRGGADAGYSRVRPYASERCWRPWPMAEEEGALADSKRTRYHGCSTANPKQD